MLVLNLIVASSLVKSPVLELYLTKINSSLEQAPVLALNLKETGACSELVGACSELDTDGAFSVLVSSTEKSGSVNVP